MFEEELVFLEQIELSILMPKPPALIELWNNTIIQFGYIAFFSLAFPGAPFWGLLINIFHVNMCFYSFHTNTQRPICLERGSIGIWNVILFIYSLLALVFNTGILLFTSRSMFSLLTYDTKSDHDLYKIAVILGITENIVFVIKYVLSALISDKPKWVKSENKYRKKKQSLEEEKFKVAQHNAKLKRKMEKKGLKEDVKAPIKQKKTLYQKLATMKGNFQVNQSNMKRSEFGDFNQSQFEKNNDFEASFKSENIIKENK